uniref:Autophagy-related protein 2 n=1 Tax=Meloidogyne hapla TaxID=6305 RepID=A0A1I8B679_MELHA
MGQYLKTELTSDQLEIRLADGIATVQSVMLNTEYINEMLVASVSSFIGSIASSMDLAKSFIVDEHIASGNMDSGGGIEQFACVIDQIIARIKFVFEDIVLRIDSYKVESGLCTGIEIQIDRMEFLDEIIDELVTIDSVVTEQPDRNSTDLNKLIKVQGVRLYTDIWTPLVLFRQQKLNASQIVSSDSEPDVDPMGNSSLNYQSCYSNFSSRSNSNTATRLPVNSISPNPVLLAQLFSETHTIRIRTNNNRSNNMASTSEDTRFNKRVEIDVSLSSPLYALLTASQMTMLKTFFMSLLPKVKQPNQSTSNFTGCMPMKEEHFTRMMNQMQNEFIAGNTTYADEKNSGTGFLYSTGTWSGNEPQFFDLSDQHDLQTLTDLKHVFPTRGDQQNIHERLAFNLLHDSKNGNSFVKRSGRNNSSTSTLVDFSPDIFDFSLRAPAALIVVTHYDPLSVDSLKEHNDPANINQQIQTNIDEMAKKAEHFFGIAKLLRLDISGIKAQKASLSDLYSNSHMRILAHDFCSTYSVTNNLHRNSIEFTGSLHGCDIVEFLKPSDYEQTQLVLFSNNTHDDCAISIRLLNSSDKPQRDYSLLIEVGDCRLEIDPSIIDRFGNFFNSRPFFYDYKHQLMRQPLNETSSIIDHGILSDLLENDAQPISLSIICSLKKLILVIRAPNIDSSISDGKMKDSFCPLLHNEVLQFEIKGATIELPKSVLNDLQICGTINLNCQTLKGSFIGDPTVLKCGQEQMNFLFVETTNADKAMGNVQAVGLKFTYDLRDKSLSRALLLNSMNISQGIPEVVFNSRKAKKKKIEGPDHTKDVFHLRKKLKKEGCHRRGRKSESKDSENDIESSSDELLDDGADLPSTSTNVNKKRRVNVENNIEAHNFSIGIHFERARFLLRKDSTVTINSLESQIGTELLNGDLFLVDGFKGSTNISYIFLTSSNAQIFHKSKFLRYVLHDLYSFTDLFGGKETPFGANVLDNSTFLIPKNRNNVQMCEIPKDHPSFERFEDDNFVCSMRTVNNPEKNSKDILLAVGLRNTLMYVRPVESLHLFWPLQLLKFFDCDELFNPGYQQLTAKVVLFD